MTNHVHWVRVARSAEALQRVLRPVHRRYAQRVNRERGWKGHLWQGRFFASPLDEAYLWAAIRYVEKNPVRAGMIDRAEAYRWSSAACPCGLRQDKALTVNDTWTTRLRLIPDGSAWLAIEDEPEKMQTLRQHIEKGLPCGSEAFVRKRGRRIGRELGFRSRGRPRKEQSNIKKG